MSKYGEAIMERREVVGYKHATELAEVSVRLERENPAKFRKFSQQTLSRWENDRTGERIEGANAKALRTLAYLLKWDSHEFYEYVGVAIGPVPELEDEKRSNLFTFLERFGDKGVFAFRIPVFGSVAAGIKGFEVHAEPEEYIRFDASELPADVEDPSKLYLVRANGNSMYEEGMSKPIPDGAFLMVEAGAMPAEGKIVVAYIPERDLGVVKEYRKSENNSLLRSYRVGGPMFWASDHPDMRVEGVVRRVTFNV
jgi:SOS-response transcriptional repressor LexA